MRLTIATLFVSAVCGFGQSPAETAFNKLKALVGEWDGPQNTRVTYRLASGGTTVIETVNGGESSEMMTVYHRDGDSLLMTHYCMSNNQPRMRATPKAGDASLKFEFVDVANLKSPDAGHMRTLQIHFDDPTHVRSTWGYREKGADQIEEFKLVRKK